MAELVERVDAQDLVLGVVDRNQAIRHGWLHRVATTICRDDQGRILVYRRAEGLSRFPGYYDVAFGGAVGVGESYAAAAARELAEELGVRVPVRFMFKFLCQGVIGSYWLGVHEAIIAGDVQADPQEIAWHGWMTRPQLCDAQQRWRFIPDGQEAYVRYRASRRDFDPDGSVHPE